MQLPQHLSTWVTHARQLLRRNVPLGTRLLREAGSVLATLMHVIGFALFLLLGLGIAGWYYAGKPTLTEMVYGTPACQAEVLQAMQTPACAHEVPAHLPPGH